MSSIADLIYVGRSRLHKPRANVVQTRHMLKAWGELGLKVRGWFPPWRGETPRELAEAPGLEVRGTQWLHPRWGFKPFVWRFGGELRGGRCCFTRDAGIALALARRGIGHTLELHDVHLPEREGQSEAMIDFQRAGVIERIVTMTRADARWLAERGADERRIHVASNGVDVQAFSTIAGFDPQRLSRPHLVYVGRITHDRGLGVFEALAHRLDARVTLVGELAESVVDERLTYVPFVPPEEVPGWYGQCDLVLLPYQTGLGHAGSISPIKLFEAMAAGRPIVASRLPTIEEVLEHERTGLLVDPGDLDAWEQAVHRLQNDPHLAAQLAANARAEAAQYSWRNRARRISRLMNLQIPESPEP